MSKYNEVKQALEDLFVEYDIGIPSIKPALLTDKCDTTYPPFFIRIKEVDGTFSLYQARHIFGHYLADLHAISDSWSEKVADTIADMLITSDFGYDKSYKEGFEKGYETCKELVMKSIK